MLRLVFSSIFIIILAMMLKGNPTFSPITCSIHVPTGNRAQVWQVLLAVEEYHHWNPSRTGSGVLAKVGQRIEWILANGVPDFAVVSKLSALEEVQDVDAVLELEWTGGIENAMFILNGRHWFAVSRHPDGGVLIEQGEELFGIIPRILFSTPYLSSLLASRIQSDMEKVNIALKNRAQSLQFTPLHD